MEDNERTVVIMVCHRCGAVKGAEETLDSAGSASADHTAGKRQSERSMVCGG